MKKMFEPITQNFTVSYQYKLYFTKGLFDMGNPLFDSIIKEYKNGGRTRLLFVVDDGVVDTHPTLLEDVISYCQKFSTHLNHTESLVLPGGEGSKNDKAYVDRILNAINKNAICRHSFVVIVGGGAIIDMAGYASAIAHRGVKLIRIPTTVLSQNDSAVGVKNGINALGKKNFLGTFATPYAIINDSDFLKTLKERDWIAGIAEALKVALIKDADFFHYISKNANKLVERDMEIMQYTIYKCAEMHMQHIALGGDPFENGSSRPLDFGHWAAHKLEQMTDYDLRHGEAVAKGIALDVTYAHLIGLIKEEKCSHILSVFENIGFDLYIPIGNDGEMSKLLKGIQEFREHLGGRLTITLISGIGMKHDVHDIDIDTMKKAVKLLNATCKLKI